MPPRAVTSLTLAMEFIVFLVFAVVLLIGWLVFKAIRLSGETKELHLRLGRIEEELFRLQERMVSTETKPATAGTERHGDAETGRRGEGGLSPAPAVAEAAAQRLERMFELPPTRAEVPPVVPVQPEGRTTPPPPLPPVIGPEPVRAPAPWVEPRPVLPAINWEQFMGVKLFAWIGGLALFLGVAFFVKYSFDNNLVPPELRVALGFLTGIGLLVGGFVLKKKDYVVTSQTLCATGVLILYATTFACRSIYRFEFFDVVPTFLLMGLITTTAFLLAVRMEAQVVAVLGIAGGFLTPVLVRANEDNPLGLFAYVALLDLGLMAVALHRRWNYLVLLGAIGTVIMQLGWVSEFFQASKVFIAMAVFLGFDVLFLAAFAAATRRKQSSIWMSIATLGVSFVSLGFVFYLLTVPSISERPPVIFSFVLGADLCLLALVVLDAKLHPTHLVSGMVVFLLLSVWTLGYLTTGLLNWALGLCLLFAVLHAVFPLVLQRLRPGLAPVWWGHLFPPLALVLVMLPMFRFTELTWFLWPCVLLIDVLAVGLAVLTASLLAIVAVLVLTVAATAVWLVRVPAVVADVPELLVVIGGFAVFFFIVGVFAGRKVFGTVSEALGAKPEGDPLTRALGTVLPPEVLRAQLPALSAILPFMLLIMVVQKLGLTDPSPVFGLALLMVVLLLGVARAFKLDALTAVGLACTLALEHVWHTQHFQPATAAVALGWYLGFFAVFAAFPFLFRQAFAGRALAWAVAALSGPAHFYLVHNLVSRAYPNSYMGLVPAAFALPALASLVMLLRQFPAGSPKRVTLLAWFGGVALFFITLVFPIQFNRQWITIGWALEGAALLWLLHRVPHPGLRVAGVGLLLSAFARLALNPAVLAYHSRAAAPILNWFLYAYGLTTVCLFAGAWLLREPRNRIGSLNVPPILTGLGATLAFLLVNIEIADYFTAQGTSTLTFEFSGNFGRDMTYTIAWAVYALVLLVMGFWKQVRAARYAGLGLLSVALLKLFFHDLAELAQLYRIGALIAVAVIAILASFLYQRFFASAARGTDKD